MESVFGEQLTVLREIHCLVCSYLHQTFIAEPSLVKLIHFQVRSRGEGGHLYTYQLPCDRNLNCPFLAENHGL